MTPDDPIAAAEWMVEACEVHRVSDEAITPTEYAALLRDLHAILDRAKLRAASQDWPARDALLGLVHDLESRLQQEQGAD